MPTVTATAWHSISGGVDITLTNKLLLVIEAWEEASESELFKNCWTGANLRNGVPMIDRLKPSVGD